MDATPLAGWDNFYVIVGSAAGGLTGLTFVVVALVRDANSARPEGVRAFLTPTIVHFCGVLALAAYLSMPHQRLLTLSLGFEAGGVAGVIYGVYIGRTMRRVDYAAVREDWIWNVILPTLVYAALFLMGILIWHRAAETLFGVAALSLLMLLIGIHNAWDIAVWMAMRQGEKGDAK
jgi:hypothetical protein